MVSVDRDESFSHVDQLTWIQFLVHHRHPSTVFSDLFARLSERASTARVRHSIGLKAKRAQRMVGTRRSGAGVSPRVCMSIHFFMEPRHTPTKALD